jgi:phosphate transport system substrate-binding protein
LALFALALGSPAPAAETSADDPAVWFWAQDGRPLPEPEFCNRGSTTGFRHIAVSRECDSRKARRQRTAILPKLVDKWLQAFRSLYPNARVAVPPPYLGPQGSLSSPMQKFLDGRSDFAFVSRDLAASDLASFRKAHGYDALSIRVAAGAYRHFGFVDAVTVIVNAQNPIECLDFTQLDASFSKSRLRGHAPARTWGDVGVAQWSDKPIHVVGASA